jgi:hypothetical protein
MNGYNLTVGSLNMPNVESVLDMKTGILSYTYISDMEGKLRFSGASNGKAFATGIVDYYGIGQTVDSGAYNELLFSGAGGSYVIGGDLDISSTLIVTNGAVNVQGTAAVSLGGAVVVTSPGTLIFQNNASLIQTSDAVNSGNVIVKRNTSPLLLDDYTYWSSPTSQAQTLYNFSPNTQSDKYYIYDNNWFNVNATTTFFTPGIGYAIRAFEGTSSVAPSADSSSQFYGIPNNGPIAVPVVSILENGLPVGLRLIGNPYAPSIDADAFIDANLMGTGSIKQTITGTLYFWTHNHRISGNSYDGDVDYASYTKSGGIGVPSGTGNVITPTGDIASGQGFFVEVDATGEVVFNNEMRATATNTSNNNFYRQVATKNTKADDGEEKSRMWFNLTNGISGSQALVGYVANATNDYDPGYDGLVYNDTQPFAIYSVLGISKLAIQGKALPFAIDDIILLGYAMNVAGNATITLDHTDGLFLGDQNIYLEDKLLNVTHDIRTAPYNFISAVGTFNDRFVLRYTDKTLGVTDFQFKLEN